jgi:SNF2 family DNA or RNA helicase
VPAVLRRNDKAETLELDLSGARGSEFQDALFKIKEIPGRRYDGARKIWSIPLDPEVAHRAVATIRPKVDQEILDWIRDARTQEADSITTPLPDDAKLELAWANKRMPWQPEFVNDEPFTGLKDYQRAAVDLMVKKRRAILGDDMGLGKTIQAIATVQEYLLRQAAYGDGTELQGPKLIICPASVKGGWLREIKRWLGPEEEVMVITGTTKSARHNQLVEGIKADAWIITNWEQIVIEKVTKQTRSGAKRTVKQLKEPLYEKTPWLAVIADEVHRAKNRKALRTEGLWRVRSEHLMLGLTGTPVQNSPDELWAILRWLWPEQYNSNGVPGTTPYWTFYHTYVDAWEDPYGRDVIVGVKNPDALRFELRERIIRRTTRQVRGDYMPGRQRIYLPMDLNKDQRKLYDEVETQMWVEIQAAAAAGDKGAQEILQNPQLLIKNGAARTVRLQQVIESPALLGAADSSAVLDTFCEMVLDSRPFSWITFTKFKATPELIQDRLSKLRVGVYTGDTSPEERTELEDRFQMGDLDVMAGTMDAMREGITLTASHLEFFCTRGWVPDMNEQCEARAADRIGQQHKTMIYIAQPNRTVATSHVDPTNRKKEGIVRTIVAKDHIEEGVS